jgi:hypothetical protein
VLVLLLMSVVAARGVGVDCVGDKLWCRARAVHSCAKNNTRAGYPVQ